MIRLAAILLMLPAVAFGQSVPHDQIGAACTNSVGQIVPCITMATIAPTSLDLSVIVQPILAVIGAVIAALLTIYLPKALAAFEARTGIILTENQRQTVLRAAQTAAGIIETRLDQGVLKVAHVDIENASVRMLASQALDDVPKAAAAMNMTVGGMAKIIVGAVDTASHGTAPAEVSQVAAAPAIPGPAV